MESTGGETTWNCAADALDPGQTATFELLRGGRRVHTFLVMICATHGAVFAPDTGLWVEGPCPGARLERLAVTRRGDELVVGA
ncbi:MAG: hypothetical protein ACREI4_00090 [Candidatus Rokuibacteriota bacterium]